MEMIVDFILLAASGVATVYCFVLSRRLGRLNDMKNGIGASIATMSGALDQTQQVLALAKSSSLEGVQRLTAVLEEAERIKPEIAELLEALGELASASVEEVEAVRDDALTRIERLSETLRDDDREVVFAEGGADARRLRQAGRDAARAQHLEGDDEDGLAPLPFKRQRGRRVQPVANFPVGSGAERGHFSSLAGFFSCSRGEA